MIKNNLLRKQYTLNETNYQLKIPMELDACIPEDDCVRLIRQFVEEMDLTALYDTYERMPSEKYASPEIMLKIMLYAYHEPVFRRSTRKLPTFTFFSSADVAYYMTCYP